uniref:MFS-type transporter SLC18B1-like n=1 Tax=Hirondellea gigas TaxID=1518452 RepID=A0A2P2HZD3_9CRUS
MAQYTRRQWMTLVVFSLAQFCNAVCVSLQAPFYPHEAEMKGATATQYSFVFGIFELTVFIVSPFYGQYLEHIGLNFMNNAGIFTVSVSCIIFGFLTRITGTTLFLTFSFLTRIVEALGNAAFITTAFSIIAQEFPLNVGSAFATLETFFGLGLIAGPAVGGALYELGGFTLPFVSMGCVLMAAAATVWCFLPKEGVSQASKTDHSVLTLLREPRILLFAASTFAGSLSIGFLQATLEPHIRPLHLSPFQIGLIFVLNGLSYAVSAPIWGRLCDKWLPERCATIIGALLVVVAFILVGPSPLIPIKNSLALCITALVIHGVGFGAELIASFSGSHKNALAMGLPDNITTYGLASGLWASAFALGAFIGPSMAGIMYDRIGFGWSTTCVAGLHLLLAVVTCFCCCGKRSSPQPLLLSERASLLRPNSHVSSIGDDSTYGSADNSTENINIVL